MLKIFHSNVFQSNNLLFTFIRAQFASLLSAFIDLGTRIICFSFVLLSFSEYYRSNCSVAIGAIMGGISQCIINYKFTFQASGQNKTIIAIKFLFVWLGNLLLNMYGTTFLLGYLKETELSAYQDLIFAYVTFIVAIFISILWNFPMQRFFVFRSKS